MLIDDAKEFYERRRFAVIEDFGAYQHREWQPAAALKSLNDDRRI
ncbi:MAG TPA: hypothetical protein VEW46_01525 [Pyrinomonadaceae bacterium]|nr:hypothetical protein [Pyrinomonadaceae bacterium]